jgi:hypothetical protein
LLAVELSLHKIGGIPAGVDENRFPGFGIVHLLGGQRHHQFRKIQIAIIHITGDGGIVVGRPRPFVNKS